MKVHDISIHLKQGMVTYPGDPKFRTRLTYSTAKGDGANVSTITMGSHNGTHMDAPYHIFGSKKTLDKFEVSRFVGPALVIGIKDPERITVRELKKINFKGRKKILFRTTNSEYLKKNRPFRKNFVHCTQEAAEFLVKKKKVDLIGIDYLSIDRFHSGNHPAHTVFMKNDVLLLEAVNLFSVRPGTYTLSAAPVLIDHSDGAPVRALLWK